MYSTLLVPLSPAERSSCWDRLPREWSLLVDAEVRVFTLDKFIQRLLGLLQEPSYSSFRKRHKAGNNDCHPLVYTDNDMFHAFWQQIVSHGSVAERAFQDVAVSTYGKSTWYLLLLSVEDDNVLHRLVHSLEKEWPGCSSGISIVMDLFTFDQERVVIFAWKMPERVYAQRVFSVVQKGVLAYTMVPKRVALSLEWFAKKHIPTAGKTFVFLSEACIKQQEVIAVVAPMTSYMPFPITAEEVAGPAAQSCVLPHLETLAS